MTLDLYATTVPCRHGGMEIVLVAFDKFGDMWVQPHVAGLGPEHHGALMRFKGRHIWMDTGDGRQWINAQAVAEALTEPTRRAAWLGFMGRMQQVHQYESHHNDAARNN